jgi:hypothetical protein
VSPSLEGPLKGLAEAPQRQPLRAPGATTIAEVAKARQRASLWLLGTCAENAPLSRVKYSNVQVMHGYLSKIVSVFRAQAITSQP